MERRYELRREELEAAAVFDPELLRGLLPRLGPFLQPFDRHLSRREQRDNARNYLEGLLSGVPRKNVESIAYHHDQERQASSVAILDLPNWLQGFRLGLSLRGNWGFDGIAGRCVVRRPRHRTWRPP